jgi:hypothetical protein
VSPNPAARTERSEVPCVVHLVRAANGSEAFQAFLESWRRRDPGCVFELVLALKGFASSQAAQPYLELARDLKPQALLYPDVGLDLGVYFDAAQRLRRDRYCFMNSFSEPLVDGWLAKLDAGLLRPGAGLVGASGSWASMRSWILYSLGLPSAYRDVLPGRRAARWHLQAIGLEHSARAGGAELDSAGTGALDGAELARARLRAALQIPGQVADFDAFPAYHLRTNAFMLTHATIRRLRIPAVKTKRDAYRLESGRSSLTRQVQSLGLRTLVVDRAGDCFDHPDWAHARAFWQHDQEGLLVADNQTRAYDRGDAERRAVLSGYAWGSRTQPACDDSGTP